jgi:hypothetical protein
MHELQLKIIKDNPIGNGLDAFRASLSSKCEGASVSCTLDSLEQLGQEGEKGQHSFFPSMIF